MNRYGTFLIVAFGALSLGCYTGNVQPLGAVGAHMGEATAQMRQLQTENPHAGGTEPVRGLDGKTAQGVSENYHYNEQAEIQDRKVREQSLIKLGN